MSKPAFGLSLPRSQTNNFATGRIIVRHYCYAFAVINYLFEFNVRDGRHQRETQRYSLLDFGIGFIFGVSASSLLVELKAH